MCYVCCNCRNGLFFASGCEILAFRPPVELRQSGELPKWGEASAKKFNILMRYFRRGMRIRFKKARLLVITESFFPHTQAFVDYTFVNNMGSLSVQEPSFSALAETHTFQGLLFDFDGRRRSRVSSGYQLCSCCLRHYYRQYRCYSKALA
jgi:hypothetical protein